MEEKMIRADKKSRTIYLIIIIIIIILAVLLYKYWQDYYRELSALSENHPDLALMKVMNLIKVFIIINPVITFGFMIYFILMGVKTYKSELFPPPGIKVIRDTRLIEGDKARKFAIGFWLIAALLLVFTVGITILLNNFLKTII